MNGWVKLHRSLLENDIWREDKTAWHVFEALLLLADIKTGAWKGGRFQLAELCKINPNTLKDAIKRLEVAEMVTTSSTNKYTVFRICNWEKYQLPNTSTDTNKTPLYKELKNNIYINKPIRAVDNVDKHDARGTYSPAKEKIRQALKSGELKALNGG